MKTRGIWGNEFGVRGFGPTALGVLREEGWGRGEFVTSGRVKCSAFTLMELLAVIAIIVVVASLTLGTLGFVNRKGAEGRAKAEVAALAAAIDSFQLDHGAYPAPDELFNELTGQGTVNTGKVYFEPRATMIDTNSQPIRFMDPWGAPYNYRTNNLRNVGFFDLWSTAGGKKEAEDWIHN